MPAAGSSSPAKRRRVSSPSKAKSGDGGKGKQVSVLQFFSSSAAISPAKVDQQRRLGSAGDGIDGYDSDIVLVESSNDQDVKRPGLNPVQDSCVASGSRNSSGPSPSAPNRSPLKESDAVPCPICHRHFPFRQIAAHASSCLDFQDEDAPVPDTSSSLKAEPARTTSVKQNGAASTEPSADRNFSASNHSTLSTAEPSSAQAEFDGSIPSTSKNVFTHLMQSHSVLKQWASADAAEAANQAVKGRSHFSSPRSVPFYKIVTGTPISVDAFRFGKIEGCTAYFLTHFHGDHYGGMTANWRWGPIYGSHTTCALVVSHLGVNPKWVRPLPMEEKVLIENTGGVHVTLLDANHCPGSNLFLFEGPQTVDILRPQQSFSGKKQFRALHCGDFRASPRHTNHPKVLGVESQDEQQAASEVPLLSKPLSVTSKSMFGQTQSDSAPKTSSSSSPDFKIHKIDTVYLDTTYLNPRYCFPAQEQVVQACAELVIREAERLRAHVEAIRVKTEGGENGASISVKDELSPGLFGMMGSWLNGKGNVKGEPDATGMEPRQLEDELARLEPEAGSSATRMQPQATDDLGSAGGDTCELPSAKKEYLEPELEEAQEEQLFRDVDDEAGAEGDAGMQDDDMQSELPEAVESPVKAEAADELSYMRSLAAVDHNAGPAENAAIGPAKKEVKAEQTDKKSFLSWFPPRPNPNSRRKNRLLVLVGTYTIGKEKIVKACAHALQTRIFCPSPRKYDVYDKLEDPELHSLLTRDPAEADVFVTSLGAINGQGLHDLVAELRAQGHDIRRAIAFRPTGWTYKPPAGMDTTAPDLKRLIAWNQSRSFGADRLFATRDSTREYQIYGVPYSEHSSFFELTAFALSLKYDRIIATVNVGNPTSRAKMEKWFERWMLEKKRRQKAGEPDRLPSRTLDYW
ncbi:DNA cross-link repair protein PSO2/SNM1 [Tilletia horrida]|nr:DNA cross-link repair protein PSO2/SNM1 [Tilletia horrida]